MATFNHTNKAMKVIARLHGGELVEVDSVSTTFNIDKELYRNMEYLGAGTYYSCGGQLCSDNKMYYFWKFKKI